MPVSVGDMVFVDAGTVHAIGPGVVLLETQQTSDVTFRLYRLWAAAGVASGAGAGGDEAQDGGGEGGAEEDGWIYAADRGEVFCGGSVRSGRDGREEGEMAGAGCLVGLSGTVVVITPGEEVELLAGQAVVVPVGCGEVYRGVGGRGFVCAVCGSGLGVRDERGGAAAGVESKAVSTISCQLLAVSCQTPFVVTLRTGSRGRVRGGRGLRGRRRIGPP